MELTASTQNGIEILALNGRFDAHTTEPISKWTERVTKVDHPQLIIDLSNVNFLDSSALSALVQTMKRARQNGGDLYLCGIQNAVRIIFELTRLDKAFAIYDTCAQAQDAFAEVVAVA